MLTAAGLITDATQAAHCPHYTAQAIDFLNSILSDLCEEQDLGVARGIYSFSLNPSLSTNFGSGPYPMPLDYLRTSGSTGSKGVQTSAWYVYNNVPYYMQPDDLANFDMQIMQQGINSLPGRFYTDVSPIASRVQATTTAQTTLNSATITVASAAGIADGQGAAGDGIAPGSTVTSVSGTTITLSLPATATYAASAGAGAASVYFGTPVNAYVYPPPLGAYPTNIRYQRLMPPIQDTARYPWFPNQGYLMDTLVGWLCDLVDDTRTSLYLGDGQREGRSERRLRKYLQMKDDSTNRAETMILDKRRFGNKESRLKPVKIAGW